MKARRFVYFLVVLMFLGIASMAQAQATRTWVSGVGDDANPCSRTAPCKTYAGAISKTAAGGIISTLDPGGFGAVTITKSITIDGSEQIAGVLTSGGANGIIINAATTDVIVLRSLEIHGVNSGNDAVRILAAGEVSIENCRIQNFASDGVEALPSAAGTTMKVSVSHTDIRNVAGAGIRVAPTNSTALVKLTVSESKLSGSNTGILIGNINNSVAVLNSELSHNSVGIQVEQSSATAFLQGCLIAYNGTGINSGLAGLTPVTRISGCTIVGNTVNGIAGTGTVVGLSNNMIFGNTGSNAVSSSVAGQ